jgi:hypothetical protein
MERHKKEKEMRSFVTEMQRKRHESQRADMVQAEDKKRVRKGKMAPCPRLIAWSHVVT